MEAAIEVGGKRNGGRQQLYRRKEELELALELASWRSREMTLRENRPIAVVPTPPAASAAAAAATAASVAVSSSIIPANKKGTCMLMSLEPALKRMCASAYAGVEL